MINSLIEFIIYIIIFLEDLSMNETFEASALQAATPMSFMKSTFTSGKKMLVIVIAYVASLVSSLIGVFTSGIKVSDFVDYITAVIEGSGMAIDSATQEALDQIMLAANTIDAIFLAIGLISLIPVALMAAGAYLIYSGALKEDASKASLGTLLFRILFTYQLVVYIIGMVLAVLCAFALSAVLEDFAALFILIGIIACVPLLLSAIYYGKFAKMFKNLGVSIRTGTNELKVSSYVNVINWIAAICGIISAVSSLGSNFLGAVGSALAAVALMFVAMLFSEYKEKFGDPVK
jgi:hypothetical protein